MFMSVKILFKCKNSSFLDNLFNIYLFIPLGNTSTAPTLHQLTASCQFQTVDPFLDCSSFAADVREI